MEVYSQPLSVTSNYPLHLAYGSDSLSFNITGPGTYAPTGNVESFLEMASNNSSEYISYTLGPVNVFFPEQSFYNSKNVDLFPFEPRTVELQVSDQNGGLSGRLAFYDLPEPSSFLLFMAIIVGLLWKKRSR